MLRKNVLRLIEIFKAYHTIENDSKLVIVGDGPLLDKMKTSYGLSDYVIKKGSKSGKTKLYAEITLYPIYAVETIDVTISIQDEDVSVS